MSHRGSIKPLPPLDAPAPIMADARANVAKRLAERGHTTAADRIASGIDADCWAMRHEVARLQAEVRS